jgi:hypothetical protein
MIRVLQTLALPLGHVAVREVFYQRAGVWSSKTNTVKPTQQNQHNKTNTNTSSHIFSS